MPRIDKVRLDNYYNGYQNRTTPVRRRETEEPVFPFDPEEKGVIYEPSSARTQAKEINPTEAAAANTLDEVTPIPENTTEAIPEAEAQATPAQSSLTDWLRGLGSRILTFLRNTWSAIWNGPEGKTEEPTVTETVAEEEERKEPVVTDLAATTAPEDEISDILAERDLERLVRFVTADGEKKPARSTDLLTIYNRYGRVNQIDPSDRKKILEGNFHDIKL